MHTDFRDVCFNAIYNLITRDRNVLVLTNDMGALGLDKIRSRYAAQVINVAIAEQNMMSVAAGLALAGKKVFAYGIIPHITARCFEQIKLDICSMRVPVTIVGVGSGLSYGQDGLTH